MKKIHLTSLGCAKNLVDSERLLASAVHALGLETTDELETADLLVVNTCAFLQSAVEEALDRIMDAGARKKPGAKLMVLGCLPSRYRQEEGRAMAEELPEVDHWLAPEHYHNFEAAAAELLGLNRRGRPAAFAADSRPTGGRLVGGQVAATPFFRSFLKISEGCNNKCTYCLIPRLRGPLKSYPLETLLAEADQLAGAGVKELTLVAQDLTAYGLDSGETGALGKLVRRLADIPGLEWIRLLYAYPERLDETLIKDLASIPKVLPYLDLPFQHVSSDILKRMGRPRTVKPAELVKKLRRWWPGLALRTTLIVGFPGESEAHFEELMNFVEEAAFDHLGVFKFSPEPEAPASRLPDPTPQHLKEKRRRRVMAAQKRISLAHNRARLGQSLPVLVEGPAEDSSLVMTGRAYFQAPEVDGLIYFDGEQPQIGDIVETRLLKAAPYDLAGTIAD